MISIGDSVRLLKHPTQPDGKITEISYMSDMVTVKWDNIHLIPRSQEYPREMFSNGTFLVFSAADKRSYYKCECGSKYDRDMPEVHSHWCPAFKGN